MHFQYSFNITPQAYRYGQSGAMEATGRVAGREIVAGQGEPYFVKTDLASRTSRVLMPDASGDKWRASTPVYQYTGAIVGANPVIGALYITGEPTVAADAPKKWQIKTVAGTMSLYLDGGTAVATGVLDGSGNGSLTYEGVRCEVVGTRYGEQWTWTHTQAMDRPQLEMQSSRSGDGKHAKFAVVDQSGTAWSSAGPERHVVEYSNDNMGRLVKKVTRDSSNDDDSIRHIADYEYNGRGQMTRERILRQDLVAGRMVTTQDIKTTYDLGGNPTEIKFTDEYGLAYTETRSYGRGYQITDATVTSARTSGSDIVTVSTAGAYTYDVNNNMLTTKSPVARNRNICIG
jgi:hypothetical protein